MSGDLVATVVFLMLMTAIAFGGGVAWERDRTISRQAAALKRRNEAMTWQRTTSLYERRPASPAWRRRGGGW